MRLLSHIQTHTVSPYCIIEAVRLWLQQESNSSKLDRVIFSARANLSIVEKFMQDCFPLFPFTQASSPTSTPTQIENGTLDNIILESDTHTTNNTEHSEMTDEEKKVSTQTTNVSESDTQNEDLKTDILESEFGELGDLIQGSETTNTKHVMSKQESTVSAISVDNIELEMDDFEIGMGDSGSGMGSSESDSLKNGGSGLLDDRTSTNSSAEDEATPTRSAQTPPLNARTRLDDPGLYLSRSLPAGQLQGLLHSANEGVHSFTHRTAQFLNPDRVESDV